MNTLTSSTAFYFLAIFLVPYLYTFIRHLRCVREEQLRSSNAGSGRAERSVGRGGRIVGREKIIVGRGESRVPSSLFEALSLRFPVRCLLLLLLLPSCIASGPASPRRLCCIFLQNQIWRIPRDTHLWRRRRRRSFAYLLADRTGWRAVTRLFPVPPFSAGSPSALSAYAAFIDLFNDTDSLLPFNRLNPSRHRRVCFLLGLIDPLNCNRSTNMLAHLTHIHTHTQTHTLSVKPRRSRLTNPSTVREIFSGGVGELVWLSPGRTWRGCFRMLV